MISPPPAQAARDTRRGDARLTVDTHTPFLSFLLCHTLQHGVSVQRSPSHLLPGTMLIPPLVPILRPLASLSSSQSPTGLFEAYAQDFNHLTSKLSALLASDGKTLTGGASTIPSFHKLGRMD